MILGQSDEFLLVLKESCLSQIADIDRELANREKERKEVKFKKLLPHWEDLVRLSFLEGYHTGVTWEFDYVPGGPSIQAPCQAYQFHRTDMTHEEFNARAALSQVQHVQWMRGFHEGRNYRDGLKGTSNGN